MNSSLLHCSRTEQINLLFRALEFREKNNNLKFKTSFSFFSSCFLGIVSGVFVKVHVSRFLGRDVRKLWGKILFSLLLFWICQ